MQDDSAIPASNFEAANAFATMGLREKEAGRRQSASGPGSSLQVTRVALRLVEESIINYGVRSILDLGCGDWNWMRQARLYTPQGDPVTYQGWDASKEMVDDLNTTFGAEHITFHHRDAVTHDYPKVDLVIARDILFHMRQEYGIEIVRKVREMNAMFLSTSFLGIPKNSQPGKYNKIDNWGFYRINLNVAPFDLAENLVQAHLEPGCESNGRNRYFCMYDFGD